MNDYVFTYTDPETKAVSITVLAGIDEEHVRQIFGSYFRGITPERVESATDYIKRVNQ